MISPSCGKVCSNSKGQKNLGASIQKNFGRFSEKRPKFFLCTFGAKSTKILRTSFSAGLREPRRCTGRARSSLCATPWRTRRSPRPLFPRQTRVRNYCAASGGSILFGNAPRYPLPLLFPHGGSRLGSDGGKADGRLKATAAETVCLQTRAVARRRFQPSGRRHRNRSGGFCCFSPSKSREKSFPELYAESSRGFRKVAVLTNFFLLVLLGPKVPKASARRFPRDCANRGAAARTLFFRVKRECGLIVPPATALYGMRPAFFLPARRSPTWFRWRKSGRRLKARAAGTVCLQTRG